MTSIRAISVRQPWAALIAHDTKRIENRTWGSTWRGTLLIHASKAAEPDADRIAYADVRGAIVAVATLADCHPYDGQCTPWSDPDAWHWVLTNVRPLARPIKARGSLGLWTPPTDLLTEIPDTRIHA
jgi:ASCH domain